ncbi:DNA-directed RNA polymerase [Bacillus mesophilus]|uniref:Sigma-70 family RNA polymerase sigma factor n=1 Tax=Bacillus mesophilus TaxID=1808955 RepID=A0A6M0Q7T3_9BACI|nr:sigma-70 family RNA polymerase sigma factor [Bacillus mesophilus]MBM7661753.1 DNA-directed RNA polymerase [Bacillus mesophilus]NEY72411.1 sigma-70 family RNA polymerase sigma factor [Bacillus mesophilus]
MKGFERIVEEDSWIIKSAIKDLCIYKNLEEYYQEGLIGLWEAYIRFDPSKGASFRTFAYRTIRGKLLTCLKKAKQEEDHLAILSEAIMEVIVDERAEVPLEIEILSCYCNGLTLAQKTWVYKTFVEDKGPKAIAKEEGVSLETVKSWRRYALEKMRREVGLGDRHRGPVS